MTGGQGLLVGYGSIGRHHAQVLSERCDRLVIVDADEAARVRAAQAHPDAAVVGALAQAAVEPADTTAVVATWGPSHLGILDDLVERGVRRVLVEKPLATSLAAGAAAVARARERGVRLGTHLHLRHGGLLEGLRELADTHALGPIEHVVVDGGARCLVTNGIHYLDFAAALFGRFPERVISTAQPEAINPRSRELGFYGGTAVWSFGEGRELVVSFTNRASLYERIRLYHRHAVIDLSIFNEADVLTRDPAQVARDASVTRSGAASERVFSGPAPGLVDLAQATGRILDELENGGAQRVGPEEALLGVGAIIGALRAGETGCAVELPLDPASDAARRDWPIS